MSLTTLQEVADEVKNNCWDHQHHRALRAIPLFCSTHGTQIAKLSGGEKKRLYLLKILIEKPNCSAFWMS